MKILVIDDNPADREICLQMLRGENVDLREIREASSVAEAIEAVGDYEPDCVFLDYLLPDGDGFRFLSEIAANTGSAPFPVILMTGMADQDIASQAIHAGAQDYLEKDGLNGPTLVRVVRHSVDRHRILQELRLARDQAERLATHCPLTGLPNRFLFRDRLVTAVAAAERSRENLGVFFIDIDRFKVINDSLGHLAGDTVLAQVGERLARATRDTDTVARVGGDEFTVLLPHLTRTEDAGRVSTKILDALCAPMRVGATELRVSVSVGIAMFPNDGGHAGALLQHADTAMYRAKEEGGGSFRYYADHMNRSSVTKLSLERDLRTALERDELDLHFQPKLDLRDGTLVGAEALVRWTHAELGPIPPSDFVPLAEETGLIVDLGEWVLRRACRTSRDWQRAGLRILPIAVNVSALQLTRSNFAELVASALAASGLDGRHLELEVTESCFMRDVDRVCSELDEIRALGVRIALDDFGTGYSSLHMLKRLPIDCLKIDRAFVHEASRDHGGAAIATAIIALAKGLGLATVAEGVERPEELVVLLENGCNWGQGFLFSPALADADFREILRMGRVPVKDVQ